MFMDPATGVFKLNIGQSAIPAYPMLKAMGATDQEMENHWGPDMWKINSQVRTTGALKKIYDRMAGYKADPLATELSMAQYLNDELPKFSLDPAVVERTMGLRDKKGVDRELLLRATQRMLNISRGEEEPDDRDAPQYKTYLGPEDWLSERVNKDAGRLTKNLLFKIHRAKSLKPFQRGMMSQYFEAPLNGSGLASPLEESNSLHYLEQMSRVTGFGEGGIGSADAITDEARDVNPNQLGFTDIVSGPESEKIGVDARFAYGTYKGNDGHIYGKFINARTGKEEFLTPSDTGAATIGFAGFPKATDKYVVAIQKGKTTRVPRAQVDFYLPSLARQFSQGINLNNMPTGMMAGRQFYASKFINQFLPLKESEAPLVDTLMPDGKQTFREYYGKKSGTLNSSVDGTVVDVTDDLITLKDAEGKTHQVEAVKYFPFNRLSQISYFPTVKPGQAVSKGDMLARSNFTDGTGSINLGRNLKVAMIPARGESHDDAIVLSETATKKMAAERLYGFDLEARHGVTMGRDKYMSLFPKQFNLDQFGTLDDNGIVKPGTVLHKGDPIMVAVGPKLMTAGDAQLGKLHRTLRNTFTDKAVTWDHEYEGTVVDAVARGGRAGAVNVTCAPPVEVGDKLCVDDQTEVLTREGWKLFKDVTEFDTVAALNPDNHVMEYIKPERIVSYRHDGPMYSIKSQQVDLVVTPNHKMYVEPRSIKADNCFKLMEPREIFGKRVSYKKDCVWQGQARPSVVITGAMAGHRWGSRPQKDITIATPAYMMLLGMYLSEGCVAKGHSYHIEIRQIKEPNKQLMFDALDAAGLEYTKCKTGARFNSKTLYEHFKPFGYSHQKFIPQWVFDLPVEDLKILFKWLMWGDGHTNFNRPISYTTVSKQLADDVQRLCFHIGISSRIVDKVPHDCVIHGRLIKAENCKPGYTVQIVCRKLTPTVNHSHVKTQNTQKEAWVDYHGQVWCCTLPKWHVMYVRRNRIPVWTGNSSDMAIKGTVGRIVPDDKMPQDQATGEPYEILFNPMAILSRVSPNQIVSMALAKVAKKTGKQIRIPQEAPEEGWASWAQKTLAENGVKDTADIFDPESGKTIKNIGDGYAYVHAFHHLSEKKLSARGGGGGYDISEQPAKGGFEGAKRFSSLDVGAALGHGVPHVIKDAFAIRGTKNEEFWKTLRAGNPLPAPQVPFIYTKFLNTMRAGGVNVIENGSKTKILPMTDRDVDKLAPDELNSSDMLDDDFRPRPGGMFDPGLTGGVDGLKFTHIKLDEPVPNPIMEEPIRRVLGLRVKDLESILAGDQQLNGKTGGLAVREALANIDPDQMMEQAKKDIKLKRGAARDNAIKTVAYLDSAKRNNIALTDWMVSKIPVLPPKFRPIARMGNMALTADMNELYRDLMETRNNLRELEGSAAGASGEDRINIYNGVKAVYGLGDPITPEGQSKHLKGALWQVVGDRPKTGMFQRQVMSKTVDNVSRAVITPDPNLDMDTIGIPEDSAWSSYKDFVIRRLSRKGYPMIKAMEMVQDRDATAKSALTEEMASRPVIVDRAPTWHKFNLMAFYPVLSEGKTIRLSPLAGKLYNADFDGDKVVSSVFVRVCDDVKQIISNKNISLTFWGKCGIIPGMHSKSETLFKQGDNIFVMDIADIPHADLIAEKDGEKGPISFYNMPDGVEVLAYEEGTGEPVWAKVGGWSIHKQREVEVVEFSDGSQSYTDDDPRAVYGIAQDALDLVPARFTPSQALASKVSVPKAGFGEILKQGGLAELKPELFKGTAFATLPLNFQTGELFGVFAGDGWWDKKAYAYTSARSDINGDWGVNVSDNEGSSASSVRATLRGVFVSDNRLVEFVTEFKKADIPDRYGDTTRYTFNFTNSEKLCRFMSEQLGGDRSETTAGSANKHLCST